MSETPSQLPRQTGSGYAERRNQWLSNAENSINAMKREIGASRYSLAAAAARDAAASLDRAAGEHACVIMAEERAHAS